MKLTEEQIAAWIEDGSALDVEEKAELASLALLGLERDERQAVTSEQAAKDIKILEQIHAKSWDEAVALRHAAEALSERDTRAERVGRAVLRELSDQGVELPGLRDGYASEGGIIAVIAAAMEDSDD